MGSILCLGRAHLNGKVAASLGIGALSWASSVVAFFVEVSCMCNDLKIVL